ncbi:uncharacterized protein L969DRAFT_42892 [Mixia osmundae IAM 14324]|uniref:Magnesium transporter n=1 Tax=Mixia osmundae (strain CBS 9802 / IAM 14324 / JCM 22182 / KY 12970) TaxID=764103 RepID=G7E0C6_MIXOS|nr:uncharacterized protein L969DRAFT_42892 [Mixia osmundae IAM 14324]KEI42278.1 hypothetical protein L969DRAFT_42892 [Mixia osmundae IAM 14324]GAA96286.1 hypothetical protein E5Q_02952 [Mixia osmundae IAM 14324]
MADAVGPISNNASLLEDKYIGLGLAISSSLAIGSSFIITKKGLIDAADRSAGYNSSESYSYLHNPIWWAGMVTMVVGEIANFAAYTFAPPILVTPLGALSVLIGAILASIFLKEQLGKIGRVGCSLCLVGSIIIVLHAPEDKEIKTVDEILGYAVQPGFMFYCAFVLGFSLYMIYKVAPQHGSRNPLIYLSICSLVGSVSVMSIKGFGIALKLTFAGNNQLTHASTYVFAVVVVVCIAVQMNYFNKALDLFSTNVVNPIYYVCFSTATIVASLILFRGFNTSGGVNTVSLLCGFLVIFSGVYLLNLSRSDPDGTANGRQIPNGPRHSLLENGVMPRMSLSGRQLSSDGSMPLQHASRNQRGSITESRSSLADALSPSGRPTAIKRGSWSFYQQPKAQASVVFDALSEEQQSLTARADGDYSRHNGLAGNGHGPVFGLEDEDDDQETPRSADQYNGRR